MLQLPGDWAAAMAPFCAQPRFAQLCQQVDKAYATAEIYPPRAELFACLQALTPHQVRAVILGQDPYHEPGQANGLAFSVHSGVRLPPSLQNILKEQQADLHLTAPDDGNLLPWAKQGVLLLNTVLTVERGKANSHRNFGWQEFTDALIDTLVSLPQPIAFVLWGAQAQKKEPRITASPYPRLIVKNPHPSPLSVYRGFYGSRPFSQVNTFLLQHHQPPIDWRLPGQKAEI